MRCHVCNADVGDGQRFCHECGESLSGVTDPTEALDMQTVFEAADGDGGSLTGALHWSDDPPDAETEAHDDTDGDAVGADELGEVGEAASHDDALPPTEVVGLGVAGGTPDPWGAPDPDAELASSADGGQPPTEAMAPAVAATTAVAAVAASEEATTAMSAMPPPVAAAPTDQVATAGPTAVLAPTTSEYPPVFDAAGDPDPFPVAPPPFRVRMTLVIGLLSILTAVLAALADVTDVRTDRVVPGIENRLRSLDDIGTNLTIAMFIGVGVLAVGGLLHGFHRRWGAGLAGGAGLALAGWAALTLGLAEVPISTAERITRDPATPGPFVLTVTRDLGYWLVIAVGALGVAAFLFSLVSAGTGGRPGLDPWSAALGALGGVVAAAGPLVPIANASFSDNFGVNELPTAFFVGRLVQVGLLGGSVMVGFLLVRAYGLGLAAGGLSIPTFMWLTTLIDVGDAPIGIGVGNLGTSDITPHAVTTVGMVVALLMLVIATTIAVARRPR